jgi:thymidylate synthase (FAD)
MKVEIIDSMGSDLSVVNAARVSFHKESLWENDTGHPDDTKLSEKDQKLIAYLARHGHWTPFGHAFLSYRIKAPIFVARQLVKHQVGLVWNEVSRRYVDEEPEFWFPKVWRGKPVNAKQGSDGVVTTNESHYHCAIEMHVNDMLALYKQMLADNIAPEQARMVLPQNMMTEWIWSGSLAAFARVVKLRKDPHAQEETREIALNIEAMVPNSLQHSWKALMADNKPVYPTQDSTGKSLLG